MNRKAEAMSLMSKKKPSATKCHQFYVHGMHCASCVVLTESELQSQPKISSAKANLSTKTVTIEGEFANQSPEQIINQLNPTLAKSGYQLSTQPERSTINWSEFKLAIPITLAIIWGFFLLQKMGIVNLITTDQINYGSAFILGIIASVSTCAAVVGSLVLAVSANYAKSGQHVKPQIMFHLSRFGSFFILGGVMGTVGSVFNIGAESTYILSFLVVIVMLILGINLLDIFPQTKKWQPTLPTNISQRLLQVKSINTRLMPLLLGFITFFLPCGFTQSMQLYALSTGDFLTGAMVMLAFALGTFPVLALLSFSSIKIQDQMKSSIFFKVSGLLVIFFSLYNLYALLTAIGIISPLL